MFYGFDEVRVLEPANKRKELGVAGVCLKVGAMSRQNQRCMLRVAGYELQVAAKLRSRFVGDASY